MREKMMQIDGFSEARRITVASLLALAGLFSSLVFAADKPNIVVIWGDDIGRDNRPHRC
jgi:hypothetical protein